METSKTDHYEKLWEKQSTSEYIGNGFLLLVLLTTNEEAICYTLGHFFFHFFKQLPTGQQIVHSTNPL